RASARGTPGTRTSAVLRWGPSGPTPKPSAPRSAKVAASSLRGAYSGGAGGRRGSPPAPVRSLSRASRHWPAAEPTAPSHPGGGAEGELRRQGGVGAAGGTCNPWESRSWRKPCLGKEVGQVVIPRVSGIRHLYARAGPASAKQWGKTGRARRGARQRT